METVALPAGTVCGGPPVVVPESGDIVAYVAIGTVSIYKVIRSSLTFTTYTPTNNTTILLTSLTIWNARMIGWGTASDTFLFSDALAFGANWPSLNFAAVGYANDGISYCVPRNVDMIVAKPSGFYSVSGILGANTTIRTMNDTLGVLPIDPIAQHNNTVYFTTSTGSNNYAVNLLAISGSRIDPAAYQRFGLNDANLRVTKTNMGYLAVAAYVEEDNTQNAICYILDSQERWQVVKVPAAFAVASGTALRFCFARGQVSRYNTAQDQNLYLCEYATGGLNTVILRSVRPNTIEPGKLSASSAPATATLKLSDISTKMPVIIRRVYVEVEMMQLPAGSDYSGSASIQAKVNNKAIADVAFSQTAGDPTSGLSTAYTFPFSTFSTVTASVYSQVRVLRFNVDNAMYGYVNEIELKFAGLRIRRCWVEGDSQ